MIKKFNKKCPKCEYETCHITDTALKEPVKCAKCKTEFENVAFIPPLEPEIIPTEEAI